MYPSGSQDGTFGTNNKNGVIQFQLAYNLTADGVVGTSTRNEINTVVLAGKGIDVSNAGLYNLSVMPSGRNEIVTFNSSEPVKAAVFYDTNSINWNNWDDEVMSMNTPEISGTQNVDNTFSTTKQFTLSNLSPNTRYNYTITTTDQAGNTSVIYPSTLYLIGSLVINITAAFPSNTFIIFSASSVEGSWKPFSIINSKEIVFFFSVLIYD